MLGRTYVWTCGHVNSDSPQFGEGKEEYGEKNAFTGDTACSSYIGLCNCAAASDCASRAWRMVVVHIEMDDCVSEIG